MNERIYQKLKSANNVKELLDTINACYYTESATLSPIVKGTIISGLQTAIKLTNCKEKKNV